MFLNSVMVKMDVSKIMRLMAITTKKIEMNALVALKNNTPVTCRPGTSSQRVLLTFKDVEGSLDKFSGDGHPNVQQWLDNF